MKKVVSILVLLVIALNVAPAIAQGPGAHRRGFLKDLDLSPEQRGQLKQSFSGEKEKLKQNMDAVRKARAALEQVSNQNEFNEQAVRTAARQLAKATEEMIVTRARFGAKLSTILSPEQSRRLQEKKQHFKDEFRNNLREKFKSGLGSEQDSASRPGAESFSPWMKEKNGI